jgi:probable rRNA maturation factor
MIEFQAYEEVTVSQETEALAVQAAELAISLAGRSVEDVDLTVAVTDDAEIARLNEQFRGVSGPTDVLSFEPAPSFPGAPDELDRYIGDVVVSLPRAQEQGEAAGHGLAYELALLVAHGVLHLLGYDHAEDADRLVMWALQEQAAREASDGPRTA